MHDRCCKMGYILACLFLLTFAAEAAVINIADEIQTYSSLSGDVVNMSGISELHITGSTTPITGCTIHLNSEDSFFFLENIKPSAVNTSTYLNQIKVNGANAVLNTNIRIVQYVNGTVVIPHSSSYQPLQIYSGFDYTGSSMSLSQYTYYKAAGLGALNDNISSFRLKRGYMATFAQAENGTGISQTYVAQDKDIDILVMPEELNDSISFVYVIPWRWESKKGTCDLNPDAFEASWRYNWNIDLNSTLNWEYVAIRQTRWWPDLGGQNWQTRGVNHLLGYNEPDSADQSNVAVGDAIWSWPDLLWTGLRVGAPAVTDSSSAGMGVNWLYDFIEQADAAGLRVDYVPIHYYRDNESISTFRNYLIDIHNRTGRPLWVTEWNDGCNWTGGDPTDPYVHADRILQMIEAMDDLPFVERYSVYNACSNRELYTDTFTPAGVVYRDHLAPAAYVQAPGKGGFGCALYEFEDSPLDSLYFQNDGTTYGDPAYTAGHSGQAIDLDGSNDYVMLPEHLADADDFTFAAWVRWDGGNQWQRLFDFGANNLRYMFLTPRSGGNTLRFAIKNGGSEQIVETSQLASGAWVHVAVTISGTTGRLYTNGVLRNTNTSMTINPSDLGAMTNYLGRSHFVQDPLYNGRIDDVHIANYALTGMQIAGLYNGTVGHFPPAFLSGSITKPGVLQGNAYDASLSIYDVGGFDESGMLTFSKVSGPAWLNVAADGTLSGTPGPADAGDNIFTVRVMDSQDAYDDAGLTIHVETNPTIAWWRFEEGSSGAEVPGTSSWTTYRVGTPDVSGNGNHLCDYWDGATGSGINYSSNVAAIAGKTNTLSGISEGGSYPSMFTWSDQSAPAGIDLETAVLSAWTIEALVYPTEIAGQNRGIVGRDGKRSSTDAASPLYFNIQSNGTLLCTYYDQAGITHDAQSATVLTTNRWYYVAATCDGINLKLWLADLTAGQTTAVQVASVNVSGSADPDFGPWPDNGRGSWSVFRGYWNSGDVDRFMGNIDEVRISAAALDINGQGLLIDNTMPPSFTADPISNDDAIELTDYAGYSLTLYAQDVDGIETVTFSKDAGPDWLTVAGDGTLSGVPGDSDVGPNIFTVRVTDHGGLYDTAAMTIAVANIYSGTQGIDDLLGLAGQWLMTGCIDIPACSGADLDGDNDVDISDFSVLASNWLNLE